MSETRHNNKGLTVLAWDTATAWCVIALERFQPDGRSTSLGYFSSDQGTASQILPQAVAGLLQEAQLTPSEVDLLAVGRGPGSFTGLRVGLALAKGMALGGELDVIGLCTLEAIAIALAKASPDQGEMLVAPIIDARHGQVFTALYQIQIVGTLRLSCLKPPQPVDPLDLESTLLPLASGKNIFIGGPAVSVLNEALGQGLTSPQLILASEATPPDAAGLARRAWTLVAHNGQETIRANPPIPMYIRQPQIWSTGLVLR